MGGHAEQKYIASTFANAVLILIFWHVIAKITIIALTIRIYSENCLQTCLNVYKLSNCL